MTDPASTPLAAPPATTGGPPWPRLPSVLRPHQHLLTYYILASLLAGPAFPLLLLLRLFRFKTLRYELDAEGITVRWGILFRREVSLTYARIQDIHLTSNLVERWLGLAKIQVQTASGNSGPEITIEGLQTFEAMRNFLYSKMKSSRERTPQPPGAEDALTATLREVAAEVRALRLGLAPEKPDA